MSRCGNCEDKRPDMLGSIIHPDPCSCDPCEKGCEIPECDCPVGRIMDKCVYYSGCAQFITGINKGMTFYQIIERIENVFNSIDKHLDIQEHRINELERRINNGK